MKENGELTGAYTRLATEKYGGMLMAPWLDRPLSIAGRVVVETENGVQSKLLNIDRDLLLIPNVAIHMNRKANDGYSWNPAVDTLPLLGTKDTKGKLQKLLEEAAGGKILGHDLYLYVREKASVWGIAEEFISSAA
ncbi:peptidase, M18 family, partial [gut metagenome]